MRRIPLVVAVLAVLGTASATLAAGGLVGTFTTRIGDAPSAQLNGAWTLELVGSGRYTILKGKQTFVTGRATMGASTITFGHEAGPGACKGRQAKGIYNWRLKGKTLLFRQIADACTGRAFVLGHAFTKVG